MQYMNNGVNYLKLMNVEWNNTYNDVVRFKTKSDQELYFSQHTIAEFEDVKIIKDFNAVNVNANYNKLKHVNYAYYESVIDGEVFAEYAFITDIIYINEDITQLKLELDVWQTYQFDFELGPCYVERGHVNRWLDTAKKRPDFKYCRTYENVEVGDKLYSYKIKDLQSDLAENNIAFLWIVSTENLFQGAQKGYMFGFSPFFVYFVPFNTNPYYDLFLEYDTAKYYARMEDLYNQYKNDNKIVAMYITSNIPFQYDLEKDGDAITFKPKIRQSNNLPFAFYHEIDETQHLGVLIPDLTIEDTHYRIDSHTVTFDEEPKIDCYPFRYYKLTSMRGNSLIMRPEHLLNDDSITNIVLNLTYYLSIGAICKEGYSYGEIGDRIEINGKTTSSSMTQEIVASNTINELPLIDDAYKNYLQSQKSSSLAGMASNLVGATMGVVGSIISGNPVAAVSGVTSGAMSVLSHMAKIQDLKDTPDGVKKSGNDYLFELCVDTLRVELFEVRLPDSERERLKKYFKAFGYAIRDFIKYDFTSRKYFNFVQTVDANIKGNINNVHLRKLKQIFDNGVRIWHYIPDDWHGFDVTLNNVEVSK